MPPYWFKASFDQNGIKVSKTSRNDKKPLFSAGSTSPSLAACFCQNWQKVQKVREVHDGSSIDQQ